MTNHETPVQITVAPCCPRCESYNCKVYSTVGMHLEHHGRRCRAAKQYRCCADCGERFTVIHIKGPVSAVQSLKNEESSQVPATP